MARIKKAKTSRARGRQNADSISVKGLKPASGHRKAYASTLTPRKYNSQTKRQNRQAYIQDITPQGTNFSNASSFIGGSAGAIGNMDQFSNSVNVAQSMNGTTGIGSPHVKGIQPKQRARGPIQSEKSKRAAKKLRQSAAKNEKAAAVGMKKKMLKYERKEQQKKASQTRKYSMHKMSLAIGTGFWHKD